MKNTKNWFLFTILILFLSVSLVSAQWTQFANTPTNTQSADSSGYSNLQSGFTEHTLSNGLFSNGYLLQAQPINFMYNGNGYIAFVDSSTLRVYDKSLSLAGSIAITNTPISQILVDSQGYIVVGSFNNSEINIGRYTFDGSSLVLFSNVTIPRNNYSYNPTGLTFDYGNIVIAHDNPVQIGFVDLDTLYFNYTSSVDGSTTREYNSVPNAFDYNGDGIRDYLIFNSSDVFVINAVGSLVWNRDRTPNPTGKETRITDVKYIDSTKEIIIGEVTTPKTTMPTSAGFFNFTAFNASNNSQVMWNKQYTISYDVDTLYRPANLQMAITDLDNNGVDESISFILQNLNTLDFKHENNMLGVIDLKGVEVVNPFNFTYNVSYSTSKAYVARNFFTYFKSNIPNPIEPSYKYITYMWTSAGKVLIFNSGMNDLIIGNSTTQFKGYTIGNQNEQMYCIPFDSDSIYDLGVLCSTNSTSSTLLPNTAYSPSSPSGSNVSSGSSNGLDVVNNINTIFPDADELTSKQKITWVLLFMFGAMVLIFAFFFIKDKGEISALALYFAFFVEILLFIFFSAIRYIGIGIIIAVLIILVSVALLLRRK